MDKIREILNNNKGLLSDISNHPVLANNIMGVLKNIEATIPEDCRENFYKNIGLLRIVPGNQDSCLIDAPIIFLDYKMLWLADNNKSSANYNFSDIEVEFFYHELLHLVSTTYMASLDSGKVNGFSGFVFNFIDGKLSNSLLNGLTEGFTQYLAATNNDANHANYDIQVSCAKKLIDTVGIDVVKQCYFNNRLGVQPIVDKLTEKGMDINYLYDLEEMCHVELIEHLVPRSSVTKENTSDITESEGKPR